MRNFLALFCGLITILIASCSSDPGPSSAGLDSLPMPDTTRMAQTQEVRIGSMDTIRVSVFGVDELTGSFQVDEAGRVKMPLVGEILAEGYTAGQFAKVLEQNLEEDYLQDADVTVGIEKGRQEKITVDGSVKRPGVFPVEGPVSLLQAVAIAGGPTDSANERQVLVFRQVNGERVFAKYNLVDIRNGNSDDPTVYGNDTIIVDGSEARRARSEILKSLPLISLFAIL